MEPSKNNIFTKFLLHDSYRSTFRYAYTALSLILLIVLLSVNVSVKENKEYGDLDHVMLYIHEYGTTPENYVHKNQSNTVEGEDLYLYATFMNFEKLLPIDSEYTEVYINATKQSKGAERLVYDETHVYYTDDHYLSFTEITVDDIKAPQRTTSVLLIITLLTYPLSISILIITNDSISISIIKNDFINDKNKLFHSYIKQETEGKVI